MRLPKAELLKIANVSLAAKYTKQELVDRILSG